jgi:hypothetical protein
MRKEPPAFLHPSAVLESHKCLMAMKRQRRAFWVENCGDLYCDAVAFFSGRFRDAKNFAALFDELFSHFFATAPRLDFNRSLISQ